MRSVVVSMCTSAFCISRSLRRYTPTLINVQGRAVFHYIVNVQTALRHTQSQRQFSKIRSGPQVRLGQKRTYDGLRPKTLASPAAIICACTHRWLRCPGWRIWSHRSRRLHTPTKSELHRLSSEQCLYRLRRAGPARTRALPSGPEARRNLADPVRWADPRGLADLVRRVDPLGLVGPLRRPDPPGLVDPLCRPDPLGLADLVRRADPPAIDEKHLVDSKPLRAEPWRTSVK
jgi:hypothetical protein